MQITQSVKAIFIILMLCLTSVSQAAASGEKMCQHGNVGMSSMMMDHSDMSSMDMDDMMVEMDCCDSSCQCDFSSCQNKLSGALSLSALAGDKVLLQAPTAPVPSFPNPILRSLFKPPIIS